MPSDNQQKIYAEFSMGVRDYERYDAMLRKADELALCTRPPHIDAGAITPYYSILKQLYINLRPVIGEREREKVDGFFKKISEQMLVFSAEATKRNQKVLKIDQQLLHDLEKMHILLLEIKQLVGLGINIIKNETLKKKMKRALLGI